MKDNFKNTAKNLYFSNASLRISSYFLFPQSYSYSNLRIFINDAFNKTNPEKDLDFHVVEGMKWLYHSYEKGFPGSSGLYNMNLGWQAPYPETTGYIIETYFDFIHYLNGNGPSFSELDVNSYHHAAVSMTEWLMGIQLECGAFPGGLYSDGEQKPNVFNTGQIMIGLLRTYDETDDEKYLKSAQKAGDWLVEIQNADGSWSNFTYENGARSYHSRVSWPLLSLYTKAPYDRYKEAAVSNIDWILKNQRSNYWFERTNFFDESTSLTHTLAYTLRGLLESGIILNDEECISKVKLTAEKLMRIIEVNKFDLLPAVFDENWKPVVNYSCLTGCAQISIIFSKLYQITDDIRYFNTALKLNSALKKSQILGSYSKNINGAIRGSYPVYGAYMPFSFPNWATKFFVDALLLENNILKKLNMKNMGDCS
ncbi:hypothetical protein [Methanosarcina sp. 1.H.A.2.2]|uniref:hypothetical protein n=1 Tax=Methanosarcina sp. 1.H.A.2.2 TaxID=1483601 RepID=UPI000621F685|nr:hypothetical protein [Methanosarcina sp. 1.H.A.2.2]KKH47203.1 hypothetical protein EO93_06180 [Methanosarcina sp. 1.H.A.2.2]